MMTSTTDATPPENDDRTNGQLPVELLDRYLTGACTAQEREVVDAWLANTPAGASRHVPRLGSDYSAQDTEAALIRVQQRAVLAPIQRTRLGIAVPQTRRWERLGMAGATALLVVLCAIGAYATYPRRARSTLQIYATHTAQRATVTLRDGSRVQLAPQTTLTVAADFGHNTRMVTLTGEALFDVAEGHDAPFMVRTGHVITRVLGTMFSIRHYSAKEPVQVAVLTGKVMSNGPKGSVTVTRGDVAIITDSTTTVSSVQDAGAYTDWRRGQLVFDRTPMPVFLATIGRWYGYELKLADSTLAAQHVSVVLKANDSADMLVALKGTLDVDLTFQGRVITLTPRRAQTLEKERSTEMVKPSLEMGR